MKIGIYKELVVCIIVIIFVITLNIITENYTKNSVETISKELEELKDIMSKEEQERDKKIIEEIKQKVNDIDQKWNEKYKKLAYYIEHDELEKVNTELVSLKANIEVEEYEQGLPDLDKCIFILEHIKEKTAVKIKNIF